MYNHLKVQYDKVADNSEIWSKNRGGINHLHTSIKWKFLEDSIYNCKSSSNTTSSVISVLDVGCGRGGDMFKFDRICGSMLYTGVDISSVSIEEASRRWQVRHLKKRPRHQPYGSSKSSVSFANTDILTYFNSLSESTTFSIIAITFTLNYIGSSAAALQLFMKQCTKHLAPGGTIIIFMVNADRMAELIPSQNDCFVALPVNETLAEKTQLGYMYTFSLQCAVLESIEYAIPYTSLNDACHLCGLYITKQVKFSDFVVDQKSRNMLSINEHVLSNVYDAIEIRHILDCSV